jgi:hypothetical protein
MKTILRTCIVFLGLLVSVSAFSLTLHEAKERGLVGEQPNGYLGIVSDTQGVSALVADINQKRKEAYQDIAKRNQTSVEAVEVLAGQKAIEKTPKGQFIKTPAGWMQAQ